MTMTLLPFGETARLIEFDAPPERLREVRRRVAQAVTGPGVLDVVPAMQTVLVRYASAQALRTALPDLVELCERGVDELLASEPTRLGKDAATPEDAEEFTELIVPVRYDGEDLADVAHHLGVSAEELVRRHQAAEWVVEFTGFTAGFGYLSQVGEPVHLTVPRRATPRKQIPAGAVALADSFAGVYPTASPGGWQLLGSTDLEMFDQYREPPALLVPGRRIRFIDAARDGVATNRDWSEAGASAERVRASAQPALAGTPVLAVETVGPHALIEDLGRNGSLSVGLSTSGAADRGALRLANRVVGNVEDAPSIEILLGGFAVRALSPAVVSVSGASTKIELKRAGIVVPRDLNTPLILETGDVLTVGTPSLGLRNYLALAGGIAAECVAGSASSDPTAGIGSEPLSVGSQLCVGLLWRGPSALAEHRAAGTHFDGQPLVLHGTWGPRAHWFTPEAKETLCSMSYQVGSDGNRVGLRFDGPALERSVVEELPSEALIRGAVQVPADGKPLMFFADHPTTGGYPVIGVIDDDDTDLLAQARPGQQIRFAIRGEVGE